MSPDATGDETVRKPEVFATEVFLHGEANPNLLPRAIGNQKYVHLTGDQVREFGRKFGLDLPERVLERGLVFIGPESDQHYEIIAGGLGITGKDKEELRGSILSMDVENAGIILGIGTQSILTGVSQSLNHRSGMAIRDISEAEKKRLDENTMVFLNGIYGLKWRFVPPVA